MTMFARSLMLSGTITLLIAAGCTQAAPAQANTDATAPSWSPTP
jgi:hypothetical protein